MHIYTYIYICACLSDYRFFCLSIFLILSYLIASCPNFPAVPCPVLSDPNYPILPYPIPICTVKETHGYPTPLPTFLNNRKSIWLLSRYQHAGSLLYRYTHHIVVPA